MPFKRSLAIYGRQQIKFQGGNLWGNDLISPIDPKYFWTHILIHNLKIEILLTILPGSFYFCKITRNFGKSLSQNSEDFSMTHPKSLQQRLSLFMILPVALLLIGMGIAGFIYARDALLSQWQEAAVLKLQRGAHQVDMHLSRIRNWIHSLDNAAESSHPEIIFQWVVEQLKAQEGVVRVDLTWKNNTSTEMMPMQPGMMAPGSAMGSGMMGSREGMNEMMRYMQRFRQARIGEITPPRFDALIENKTVSLVSNLLDKNGQTIGRLTAVLSFEYLVKNVVTSSWWQSNEGFLVDDHGKILTGTFPGKRNELAETNEPLERETLKAIKSRPYGTLLGSGHPPGEVSGFYKLQEAPWTLVMIAPGGKILAPIARFRLYYFITGAGFIFLVLLLMKLVTGRTVSAIKEVSRAAERIARGDFDRPLPVKTRDEVGDLMRSFNTMMEQLKERIRLRAALDLAMEVQQNLLPQKSKAMPGLDIAGRSLYCDETGGDYYDFLEVCFRNSNHFGLAVGDVSGHGISAALLMASVRAFLRCRVTQPGGAAEIITDVNRLVTADTGESGHFMTLFYAEIDPASKTLQWVRAGHDPALFYDPTFNAIEELGGEGMALGIDANFSYRQNARADLSAGQILLIGTDGIWETRDDSGRMFSKARLAALIREHAAYSSERLLQAIMASLKDFRGSARQEDDVTLAVVKIID
jgi:sigma-B regulation protein RsbU (phosphoserine phosphatase)